MTGSETRVRRAAPDPISGTPAPDGLRPHRFLKVDGLGKSRNSLNFVIPVKAGVTIRETISETIEIENNGKCRNKKY
jgi:hypothetical protein